MEGGKEIMLETAILHKNRNIVSREIDDEVILLPIFRTSEEINCIYTLNNVASRVWKMIDGKRTVNQIKKLILKEFDTDNKEVDKELAKLLKDLKEIKAIK